MLQKLQRAVLLCSILWPSLGLAQDKLADFNPSSTGKAQDIHPEDVIHWEPVISSLEADGTTLVGLRLRTEQNFAIYATKLEITGPAGYTLVDKQAPASGRILDPISQEMVDVYTGGDFLLRFEGPNTPNPAFRVSLRYVGCTQVICLFPHTKTLEVNVRTQDLGSQATAAAASPVVMPAAPEPQQPALDSAPNSGSNESGPPIEEEDLQSRFARQLKGHTLPFGLLLGLVFLGGLLSNLTPCVYPMIPITLRLLGNQGASPYLSASCYALGIVVTYSVLGLLAALSGGLFGGFLSNPIFNLVFACIMFVLGLGMLGFGNLSKLQMLGNRLGAGKPSLRNTFLMGAGAGLVAAPCTGPVLAALLAYTAQSSNNIAESSTLLVIYSIGFALPYVLLGGAAAKVGKIRVPHQVQTLVKLVFASVMFALSFYYLRIPFYSFTSTLKGSWPTIAGACLVGGVMLSALFLAVPKLAVNKAALVVPTVVLGLGIFAGSQWLTVSAGAGAKDQLTWYKSEAEAFAAASAANKPVMIDMWAEWCEACKKMDATTFADPRVIDELSRNWVVLKLDLTESTEQNDAIQNKYALTGLPTLVLMPPSGRLEGKQAFAGYISAGTLLHHLKTYHPQAE